MSLEALVRKKNTVEVGGEKVPIPTLPTSQKVNIVHL